MVRFLSGTATYVYIVCEWLHGTFSIEVLDGEREGAEEEERRRRDRGGRGGREEEEGQRGQGRR